MTNLMPADLATPPATRPVTAIPRVFRAMHSRVGQCLVYTAHLPGPPGDQPDLRPIGEALGVTAVVHACPSRPRADQAVVVTVVPRPAAVPGLGFVLRQPDVVLAAAYSDTCPLVTLVHPRAGPGALVLCPPDGWQHAPLALTVEHIGGLVSAATGYFDAGDLWAHLTPWPAADAPVPDLTASVYRGLRACGLSHRRIGLGEDGSPGQPPAAGLRAIMWKGQAAD
jgi:hypothetical protein